MRRLLALPVLCCLLGGGAYLFTASNDVSNGGVVGEGVSAVSGFTVGAPAYSLLASDPSKIVSFGFTISPVAPTTHVRARLVANGAWYDCTLGAAVSAVATASCPLPSGGEVPVSSASALDVVAAS
jgi:hypothetical protein